MTDSSVSYELRDRVAIITVDDGRANVVSHAVAADLAVAISRAESEAAAVVIAGRPGKFSAGFDLAVMTSGTDNARALLKAGAEVSLQIHGLRIPVVLACTGHALAMGGILLMAADVRIGARGSYKIGLNEVAIGMPVPRFAIALGRTSLHTTTINAALNLATVYDPEGAVAAGYLDELASDDDVIDVAIARAAALAETLNPKAFAETRDFLRGAGLAEMRTALATDLTTFTVELPA